MEKMKKCSERLVYREFEKDDYEYFKSIFSNSEVMKYTYMDVLSTEEALKDYFNNILERSKTQNKRKAYEYAVFNADRGEYIGFADVEITYVDQEVRYGEIGYFLLPEHWGKGYASEIANKLLEICFTELKLYKVVASCNAENKPSEKVMIKVGMKKDGELRKERFKNGKWYNELKYSILAEEWMGNIL
jgi:ribosomal-protein-alanine N-acetyltransferase